MIYLSFSFTNPFSNRFSAVYEKTGKTWNPHKFWEFSVQKDNSILKGWFEFTIRQDHAGLNFEFGILGWGVNFVLYDHRHWDDENNCWENYEEVK